MTASEKRKSKVKAVQLQIAEGIHPMQDPDVKVRKKAALRVADKMISSVKVKQK